MRSRGTCTRVILVITLCLLGQVHPCLAESSTTEVAVVHSEATRNYYEGWAYDKIMNSIKLSLEETRIPYDVITSEDIVSGVLDRYKVAILASNACMSRAEVEGVRRFVRGGGKVLGAYEVSMQTELAQDAGGMQLADVFKVKVVCWDRGKYHYIRVADKDHPIFTGVPEFIPTTRLMTFVVQAVRGGTVIGKWYDADMKTPARPYPEDAAVVVTKNTVYIGENIFDRANDDRVLRLFIGNIVRYLLGVEMSGASNPKIEQAENAVKRAEDEVARASSELRIFDVETARDAIARARAYIADARTAFSAGKDEEGTRLSDQAIGLADIAAMRTCESRPVEVRGIWMDYQSIQAAGGRKGIADILDKVAGANFNVVYPEVFYQGGCVYRSNVVPQYPQYAAWDEDPMQVIVEEAHKRGLTVYPWVWGFCAGFAKPGPILQQHPEWTEEMKDGQKESPDTTYWLQASRPEVRKWLVDAYVELATKYPVDGLHLDYVRFNEETTASFGYSAYSRDAFMREYGKDPTGLLKYTEDYRAWNAWREKQVTSLVIEATERLHEVNPDLVVSAAVGAEWDIARRLRMQNWKHWADNRLILFIKPMVYTKWMDTFRRLVRDVGRVLNAHALYYPGIYVYDSEQVLQQIQAAREMGAPGISIFSTIHMPPGLYTSLKEGPFRVPASLPHTDPLGGAVTALRDLANKMQGYIDAGSIAVSVAGQVLDVMDEVADEITRIRAVENPEPGDIAEAAESVSKARALVESYVAAEDGMKAAAAERIARDLDYVKLLLDFACYQVTPVPYREPSPAPMG